MQQITNEFLKNRIDQPFYDAVVKSAGLTITFEQVNYVAMEAPGGAGDVKPLAGVNPLTHYHAKCPQLSELDASNRHLDRVQYSTYLSLVRAVRFCVFVDGVEIFGSATALRAHGFFKNGDELQVPEGRFYGAAYVRMDQLTKPDGRDVVPYHRFFARSLSDLPKVNDILKTRGKIKEICFLPEKATSSLEEFQETVKPILINSQDFMMLEKTGPDTAKQAIPKGTVFGPAE